VQRFVKERGDDAPVSALILGEKSCGAAVQEASSNIAYARGKSLKRVRRFA
jgi:hypothetical protein